MIEYIDFVRFRGFRKLKADLRPHAFIVGPNSAGKSTVLEAVGLAEQCLRIAYRKLATLRINDKGRRLVGYPLPASVDSQDDPVRFDFGSDETRICVRWSTGATIQIVWPEETGDDAGGYFYLQDEFSVQPASTKAVRALFTSITIVPVVTPLERYEELKSAAYIEAHTFSRLASRHFRNNAWLMSHSGEWDKFREFCRPWLPEIELLSVSLNIGGGNRLVVFYSELGSRAPKELSWAGDGMQIWVQLLWHVFRARESATIVLDEPEVYLHPDVQRRLVRLLASTSAQIILASHSSDVIAEAPGDGILWVDRLAGGATRARSRRVLSDLGNSLGVSFNLALARSMRSQLVLAVDCEDLRLIRAVARQIGAVGLADEQRVSILQLRDAARWAGIDSIGESLRSVLPRNLPSAVLLQSGYRSNATNGRIIESLSASGTIVEVCERPELESYLADPQTIARVSGASAETISMLLPRIYEELRDSTKAAFIAGKIQSSVNSIAPESVGESERSFDVLWSNRVNRESLVRGSQVIRKINLWLEEGGYQLVDSYALASAIRPQSLPTELVGAFFRFENLITSETFA